jgi:rhodanese-related sulfurtransferase/DNA-binding transcriptional ArsR family regulator
MKSREFKDSLFEQFALVGSAFASPKRIELIDVLAQGERNVETLAGLTDLTVANTSRHLQVLKAARLVASRKSGLQVFYRLADPAVLRGYRALRDLAEDRLAEVERLVRDYYGAIDGLDAVPQKALLRRMREGDVTVIDVRPPEEYDAGHVKGARSVPLAELQKRLTELPAGREIVAYCRGPYCVLAAEAVRLLRPKGFHARRMSDGYPEWRDAGLPVEGIPSPSH